MNRNQFPRHYNLAPVVLAVPRCNNAIIRNEKEAGPFARYTVFNEMCYASSCTSGTISARISRKGLVPVLRHDCIFMDTGNRDFPLTDIYTQKKLIKRYNITDQGYCMANPHEQLIETICHDVLPNMVRIFESKKMISVLDQDQFVKLIEQKVERANKSLKMLPDEDQSRFRVMIDRAYAENIDRLREKIPALHATPVQIIPVEPHINSYL